jgi:hypothetical protein
MDDEIAYLLNDNNRLILLLRKCRISEKKKLLDELEVNNEKIRGLVSKIAITG